jgi:hypothetical protein
MNDNEFDLAARAWLGNGPMQMSDHAVRSTIEEIRTTRQRHAVRPAWRAAPVSTFARVAIAAVLVVAVGTLAFNVMPRPSDGSRVGGPSPSSSATANGQPIVLSHASSDGELTVSAPSTWAAWLPGKGTSGLAPGVWFGGLFHPEDLFGNGEHIDFVDPVAYDAWCAGNGGSPLLSAPADAAAIAQQVLADPNFETTTPVRTTIGGLDAVSMDVTLAPGGKACGIQMIEISRWIHELGPQSASRLRLYLVDLPEGMSVKTLAITVVAPKKRFEAFVAETAPIIESIEFHPNGSATSHRVAP